MTEPCNKDSRIRAGAAEPPLDLDGMRHAAAEDEQHGHRLQAGYLRAGAGEIDQLREALRVAQRAFAAVAARDRVDEIEDVLNPGWRERWEAS